MAPSQLKHAFVERSHSVAVSVKCGTEDMLELNLDSQRHDVIMEVE
jgi:hypothetical protein